MPRPPVKQLMDSRLLLPLPKQLHAAMRAAADDDVMELTTWIRLICLKEVRRRKRNKVA